MMADIDAIVSELRSRVWPSKASSTNPFRLSSVFEEPAKPEEIKQAWAGKVLPADLLRLWEHTRSARLFEDVDYGQWGLILLSPADSAARTKRENVSRPADFRPDDLVIGEFLGDQDLLVLAPSEAGDRRVLVALPLDEREDWFGVADSLDQFLERYSASSGDKYWEPAQT